MSLRIPSGVLLFENDAQAVAFLHAPWLMSQYKFFQFNTFINLSNSQIFNHLIILSQISVWLWGKQQLTIECIHELDQLTRTASLFSLHLSLNHRLRKLD